MSNNRKPTEGDNPFWYIVPILGGMILLLLMIYRIVKINGKK